MALRLSTGLRNRLLGINTNKVLNGTFASALTNWTNTNGCAQNGGSGANGSTGFARGAANGSAAQLRGDGITVRANRWYRLKFYIKKTTGQSDGKVFVGTAAGGSQLLDTGTISTTLDSWTAKEYTFKTDTNTTAYITLLSVDTATLYVDFDEVELSAVAKSFQDVFYKGFLEIYSGAQPSSANDAPTGTLLCTIYSNGTSEGLTCDDAVSGQISKAAAETWSGTSTATGTAGWFRLKAAGDGGASSQTDERLDGSVATSGAQLNMSSTTITSGAVQTISTFAITMPSE
jgi:hypothetical protein